MDCLPESRRHELNGCSLTVGKLDGVAVGIFWVAEAKLGALADFAKLCAACDEMFARGGDVVGIEDDLRSFAFGRRRAGVQGEAGSTGVKLPPAFSPLTTMRPSTSP